MDVRRHRLRSERLVGGAFTRPEEVVRWLGAVQSQDYAGAKWALGLRTKGCKDADVERAFQAGAFVRTHVLRPTWHFVMPEDVRWMLKLTAPRVRATMAYYDRKLELDDATLRRCNGVLAKALRGGNHQTREELGKVLGGAGIPASGQRLGLVMMRAELDAVICSGPRRGKQFTYALLDERVPETKPLLRDEALVALGTRYFTSHGPAQLRDFAWWSGLTVADAKSAVKMAEPALTHEVLDGKTYWFAPSSRPATVKSPLVHLLPNYDEYLIAFKDHAAVYDADRMRGATSVYKVLSNHFVILDGKIVGGWRRTAEKGSVVVTTRLFGTLGRGELGALRTEADRFSRFLGLPVEVIHAAQ